MAGLNTSLISTAVRDQNYGLVEEQVFRNDRFARFFPTVLMTGGATYDWRHNYAGNTAERYQEGDALGDFGSQSYITAQAPVQYYRVKWSFTGHAMDQLKNGAPVAAFFDQAANEMALGLRDMMDLVTTDMLGTGITAPVGVQGWIDSAGTIAGLDRATYTWFQAYEAAAALTTIATADLDTHDYVVRDADRGGRIDLWMTSPKQKAKWRGQVAPTGTNAPLQFTVGPNGVVINSGFDWDGARHGNAPIMDMPDLTNSVWLGLQTDTWLIALQRPVTVDEIAKVDDSQRFMGTYAVGLVCRSPKKNTKITGLTA